MISVIIPSYNSKKTIEKCLDSIEGQSYNGEHEVILVDSSTDRTDEIVSAKFDKVKLIHLDEKTDPGTARNIGIREAKGSIYAFIDSDCVASPNWLDRIASAHNSKYRVIGGAVHNGNPKGDTVGLAGYIAEFREFLPGQSAREVHHIPTCNISYKKEVFLEYGFFQGKYYPQEDLLYNHMIGERGEKILFDPSIEVYHTHRSEFLSFIQHQFRIGNTTPKVLRVSNLSGSFIVRYPLPCAILVPLLPLVKFAKTIAVFLYRKPKIVLAKPMSVAIFGIGLFAWTIGFLKGIVTESPV